MKRYICVLMVLVMAVLWGPTAGADVSTLSPGDRCPQCNEGHIYAAVGFLYCNKCCWYTDTNTMREHVHQWSDVATDGVYKCVNSNHYKTSIPCPGTKPAPEPEPEPEPVVVVVAEEKKEEPHVHAEEWVPGTPATCTHTGLTDGSKCKWCGEVMVAQTEIPKIDHVYSMWVPNGSGKHFASCLYCGNKIDAACEKVQLPIKSTSGAAVILCPVCGDCSGATATAVKGLKVGEGAPYRGTLRVWNIDAGDNNKYLAVSFDRFGKVMQPDGEVSITLPDDLKGATAGVIGANGSVTPARETNGTLKLDFTGSQVVVLKGN